MKPKQQVADEREAVALLESAYRGMLDSHMNAIVNPPLMNPGAVNFANTQPPVFGTPHRVETMFDYARQLRTNIVRADNGYILVVYPADASVTPRILVAPTIEELRDLITSELVTQSLEK